MRETKYRAWDIENEIMLPVERIDFGLDGYGFRIFCNDGTNYWWIKGKKKFELMENIGLEDKNKIEIYENDVVKYSNRLLIVKWYGYRAGFYLFEKDEELSSLRLHKQETDDFIEVVGNVFENEDLL